MRIAHEKGKEMTESMDLVTDMMAVLDRNGSGHINFNDFLAAVESTPILVDAFEGLLPSPALLKKHVPELQKIPPGGTFDWARLNDLATFIRAKSADDGSEKITRAVFRSLMEEFFGFHSEKLIGQLFDVMDSDGSGRINFRELMQGLSMALRSTPAQLAEFYFKMYDESGTGRIDKYEIYRLLERGHQTQRALSGDASKDGKYKHGAVARQHLEAHMNIEDTDGDGRISHEEFLAAVNANPELLQLFDRCVH